MPRWRLTNKLNPATKVWKSFATNIQPKLRKLLKHSLPKAFKSATRRLISSFNSFPSKLRAISNPSPSIHNDRRYESPSNYYDRNNSNPHQNYNYTNNRSVSFAAIHIDELFEPAIQRGDMREGTPGTSQQNVYQRGREYGRRKSSNNKSSLYSIEEAWRAVVAASPQLRCVDERAEEFIFKVRQDMKLQKDKSDLEFQEMLARGA